MSFRKMSPHAVLTLCVALFTALPAAVSAQDAETEPVAAATPLDDTLGEGIRWGSSPEAVLDAHRAQLMAEFRERIVGANDPLAIDRERQAADARWRRVAQSHEELESEVTGYEISPIAGELHGAVGHSMLTIDHNGTLRYFIFHNDQLRKMITVFSVPDLNWISFEEFTEALESSYELTAEREEFVDDWGIPHLIRATWDDGVSRLRAEKATAVYNSYVLVFMDGSIPDDRVNSGEVARNRRARSSRSLSDLVNSIEADDSAGNIVDEIVGSETEVHLRLRSDDESGEGVTTTGDPTNNAMDDDDELEEIEQRTRRSRRSSETESESGSASEESGSGDGLTIY